MQSPSHSSENWATLTHPLRFSSNVTPRWRLPQRGRQSPVRYSLCSQRSVQATQYLGLSVFGWVWSPGWGVGWGGISREETLSFIFSLLYIVQHLAHGRICQIERSKLLLGDFLPTGNNLLSGLLLTFNAGQLQEFQLAQRFPRNPAFKNKQLWTLGNRGWPSQRPPFMNPGRLIPRSLGW